LKRKSLIKSIFRKKMQMKIFKFISDMSNARRWSTAYCQKEENVLEHTAVVAIIALRIGSELEGVDMEVLLTRALLHDMEEIITGDIMTPTKYHNEHITKEIKKFEAIAAAEVSDMYFGEWAKTVWAEAKDSTLEGEIIRLADTAAVVYKIRQEQQLGNPSFGQYEENVWNALSHIKMITRHVVLIPFIHDLMDYLLGAEE
jgi:putative nucleotidyltransferase with HDIG domain